MDLYVVLAIRTDDPKLSYCFPGGYSAEAHAKKFVEQIGGVFVEEDDIEYATTNQSDTIYMVQTVQN